jgi:hypothetical protein
MLDLFAATRTQLGATPRGFGRLPDVPLPKSLSPDDPLWKADCERAWLVEHGVIVRSWIVLASVHLFQPGTTALPAHVVYAPKGDVDTEDLEEVAAAIFVVRSAAPTEKNLASFVRAVRSEQPRFFSRTIPQAVSGGRPVVLGSILVHRDHLPRPYLAAPLLPLLVHPTKKTAVLLPAPLWASDLVSAWVDLAADP